MTAGPWIIDRARYAELYGPTIGDRVRLADTDLLIEVTEDRCRGPRGGDEVVFGGGKVIRESMGQARTTRGEGTPDEVVERRGLKVVSDDGALVAAVDAALAAQPDIAEKIRGGKVAAAGAIVGAVMKATKGQADAKRVRELVLERVGA